MSPATGGTRSGQANRSAPPGQANRSAPPGQANRSAPPGQGARRAGTVGAVLLALSALVGAGTATSAQQPSPPVERPAQLGRTSAVCSILPATADAGAGATTSVAAATLDPGAAAGAGTLTATPLGSTKTTLTIRDPGQAAQVTQPKTSMVLAAEGSLAAASSGTVVSNTPTGPEAGLSAAPCLAPATEHWFVGLSADEADRTELVLSNPDDNQAVVDLRFFGRRGRVSVPGSPGVVVAARSSRQVSLGGLNAVDGPFTVEIHATTGRVAAAGHRVRQLKLRAAGVDWQIPSAPPALVSVVPGVPEGRGARTLSIVNPGPARASVRVRLLGIQGGFTPNGLETLTVPGETTATVDLAPGLATQTAAVKLTSDQPVSSAVTSVSAQPGQTADLAVQSAQPPLIRRGVVASATTSLADSDLVLSNTTDVDAEVAFEVFGFGGRSLRRDTVLLTGGTTATRRLTGATPAYVVVTVPDRSAVVGSLVLSQVDGSTAGLATVPLVSPDTSGRVADPVADPAVGR